MVIEGEWFMILRDAELVRWIICGKQGIETTVELAPADKTNVYRHIRSRWS